MARLFIDGFNTGDGSLWDYANLTYPADRAGFGPYCAYRSSAIYTSKSFSSKSYIYGKARMEWTGLATTPSVFFMASGAPIANFGPSSADSMFKFGTNNAFNAFGTTRDTSAVAVILGKVYLIEFYFYPLNSGSGRFVLKVDGVTFIDWTGISTYGTEAVDGIQFGGNAAGNTNYYFSDVVLDDADWIGNTRVGYKQVSGAGNAAEWTPLSGDNYANVDEIPPSYADYNSTNTINNKDTHEVGSIQVGSGGYSVNSIKSVQVQGLFLKTGSPTPTKVAVGLRTSSTDDFKSGEDVSISSGPIRGIWETNPVTTDPWAVGDSFEVGYKAVA